MRIIAASTLLLALCGFHAYAEDNSSEKNSGLVAKPEYSAWLLNEASDSQNSIPSIRGTFTYFIPDDDDKWEKGFGVEAQLQLWQSEQVGFGLSIGWANWDVADYSWSGYVDGVHVAEKVSGDATLTPIGFSLIFRPINEGAMRLSLEAGIRYVIADVNAEYSGVLTGPYGVYYIENAEYEADDAMAGVIRADLEFPVSNNSYFYVGPGYQFDIRKSEATAWVYGQKISTDISIKTFMLSAGFIMAF